MKNPVREVANAARNLSHNPLGIIALFIVLIYAIAALVFGLSGAELDQAQKMPLIWFLVSFPILVLLVFVWLVVNHHTKLYSPQDFRDKDGFFRALTPLEQKQHLDREVQGMQLAESATQTELSPQRTRDNAGCTMLEDMRARIMVAKELVFRELQAEYKAPVRRQMAVFETDITLDAVVFYYAGIVVIEVRLVRILDWVHVVREAVRSMEKTHSELSQHVTHSFVLALISEGLTEAERTLAGEKAEEVIASSQLSIDFRVYDFARLKRKYGLIPGTSY